MSRSFAFAAVLLSFAVCLGCTRKAPSAHKEIQVPEGGPPVLTSAERTARDVQRPRAPGVIAQATYQQPADSSSFPAIKPFDQWTDQDAAGDALGRIGAAAVPALTEALRSPDPAIRRKAVEVLGRMGDQAAPAVADLTALLNDSDPAVRKAAARTLGQIGPAAQEAVPALMKALFQPQLQPAPQASPQPLQAVPADPQPE